MTRLLLAAILLAGACGSKEEPPAAARPAPIPQAEQQRGGDACKAFVDRTCACAKAHPERAELADKCAHARPLPEAMEMALEVDRDSSSAPEDVFRAQSEVRQVVTACFAGVNWLATQGCP